MQIEANKTCLTAGGYVVAIAQGSGNSLLSTVETSPGVMYNERNIHEVNSKLTGPNKNLGWYYDPDGKCASTTSEWREKLRIIKELQFSLPVIPKGFKWKGDFPQYRIPIVGECFIAMCGSRVMDYAMKCDQEFLNFTTQDLRRLIVEPVAVSQQQYRDIDPKDTEVKVDQMVIIKVKLPEGETSTVGQPNQNNNQRSENSITIRSVNWICVGDSSFSLPL